MSLYKIAGLFFILISFSSGASVSVLQLPSIPPSSSSAPPCKFMSRPAPVYPPRLFGLKIEGRVKFSFDINSSGRVENFYILESQPANKFEDSVRDAVTMWRYDCSGIPRKGRVYILTFRVADSH
ncbi:TPA: TonB family protein [Salmonella enterica]|uniref:Protein TonB n=1 Tax=Salmonella enterica TaxID=28901 RepID=A0A743P4F6_SALER|nr:TonB family protein [Salmonella enterica]